MVFTPNRQKVHSLTGRITPELVLAAFHAVKRNRGAAGIDKVSIQMFAANLDANLQSVIGDLKAGLFQPKPLRRRFIDKGNGKLRPLGIPAVRDRVAQEVLAGVSCRRSSSRSFTTHVLRLPPGTQLPWGHRAGSHRIP